MARRVKLQVWINEKERARLQCESERQGVSMSEVIQDFIKSLPEPATSSKKAEDD